ncbi:MAG: YihY/virulence factor BrkB family protein [Acidimicrobiales bacterium]
MRNRGRRARQWLLDLSSELVREWKSDRVGGLAAEIAFFAVLGLFPAVLVFASLLGSLDAVAGEGAAADAEAWVLDKSQEVFGSDNSLADTIMSLFDSSNTGVLTAGLVLSLYASSRGFVAVVRALDLAYDHEHPRGWLSTRLVGLGLTLFTVVVAAVVMTMIVVGPLFGEGGQLADDLGVGGAFVTLWDWFRWPVVFVVLVSWAATVYHVGPNHRSPWRWELPGAFVASMWWLVVSLGFRVYLEAASSGSNAVFGVLGGALSLLFWLYMLSMGLLVGAELNAILATRAGVSVEPPAPVPLGDRVRSARGRLARLRPHGSEVTGG